MLKVELVLLRLEVTLEARAFRLETIRTQAARVAFSATRLLKYFSQKFVQSKIHLCLCLYHDIYQLYTAKNVIFN